ADPHDSPEESRCPRLQVGLFQEHDRGAPGEFNQGEPEEEVVREWPHIGHPRDALVPVLVKDLTWHLLCEARLRDQQRTQATPCQPRKPRSVLPFHGFELTPPHEHTTPISYARFLDFARCLAVAWTSAHHFRPGSKVWPSPFLRFFGLYMAALRAATHKRP